MASDRGPTATEAMRAASTTTAPHATATGSFVPITDPSRQKSLKRARETTPESPGSASAGDISPSKLARLVGFARQSHLPTDGAPAEDERSRQKEEEEEEQKIAAQLRDSDSHSPSQKALDELMSGVAAAESQARDSPSEAGQSDIEAAAAAAARALSSVSIPSGNVAAEEHPDVSPQTGTSAASPEDGEGHVINDSTAMDVDPHGDQRLYAPQPDAQMDEKTTPSLSYPGVLPSENGMPTPVPPERGMSMPIPGTQNVDLTPRSPSSKKHKCPYCETEFTRHHNLKSHLLTHSQEKPYPCPSCDMRFRRLHDLKRHSKLHTGEKPHVCANCDRKFARGDALARHSKGAGGCAGRRPTMGSFGLDGSTAGNAGDSAMSGDQYEGGGGGADMTEEERRRSMPSIKTQHVEGQAGPESYGAHSNTYPPAGQRPGAAGGLYPPGTDRGSSSSNTSPSVPNSHTPHTSISSVPLSAGSSSMYSQSAMTESPKALSPAGAQPNAGGQQRPGEQPHGTPELPLDVHGMSSAAKQAWLSQYPPADPDATKGNGAPVPHAAGRGRGRTSENNVFGAPDPGFWAYYQHLEQQLSALTNQVNAQLLERLNVQEQQIAALTDQVGALRQQLAASQPDGPPAGVAAEPAADISAQE